MQSRKNDISRRDFLTALGGATAVASLAEVAPARPARRSNKHMLVYVGTYTSGTKSEGIYIFKLDPGTGALSPYLTVKDVVDPSFLTVDKERRYLYAVNETVEYQGQKSGAVSSFAIDQKTGGLRFLNKQPSLGGAPCHVSVSNNGKWVLVANYVGGNIATFPIGQGGNLGAAVDIEQHVGTGPDKERQEAPHAHSAIIDPHDRFVFANDLGIDRVMIYRLDAKTGKLEPNKPQPFYKAKPGAGPRHFKLHPAGKFAFTINELDMTVSSLAFDSQKGTLSEVQTVSTLPAGWAGTNSCADLHVHPNGEFLYGSNRGHDSIVSYKIDQTSGKLSLIEHVPTGGRTPRNFAIDRTGTFLLAANQRSDSIVTFRIDAGSGRLSATGNTASVPAPVCLKLIPVFS